MGGTPTEAGALRDHDREAWTDPEPARDPAGGEGSSGEGGWGKAEAARAEGRGNLRPVIFRSDD